MSLAFSMIVAASMGLGAGCAADDPAAEATANILALPPLSPEAAEGCIQSLEMPDDERAETSAPVGEVASELTRECARLADGLLSHEEVGQAAQGVTPQAMLYVCEFVVGLVSTIGAEMLCQHDTFWRQHCPSGQTRQMKDVFAFPFTKGKPMHISCDLAKEMACGTYGFSAASVFTLFCGGFPGLHLPMRLHDGQPE
jgi:hypothetical protein